MAKLSTLMNSDQNIQSLIYRENKRLDEIIIKYF